MTKKDNPKVIYTNGSVKGIYLGHSVTELRNEERFKTKYGYTLQEVNDRILSYRPNSIIDYKPVTEEEKRRQYEQFQKWDGKTWNLGEYAHLDPNDKENGPDQTLFKDFKTLVLSSACMRGLQSPSRVRGGTPGDVDDFFNFATIKFLERRLRQFNPHSECRILDNWPSYIARVLPQYLILFNKSKFDYEVETYWPMVKDEESGKWKEQDFGVDFKEPVQMFSKETFLDVYNKVLSLIPEAAGFSSDILLYFITGEGFSNQRMVKQLSDIVRLQIYEGVESLL